MKFPNSKSQTIKKLLPFILPSIIFLVLVIFFKFNGLYGQDSHEYYRYSKDIIKFLKGGLLPANFHWPVFYPLFGAILSFVIPDPISCLQLISFVSFLVSIFFIQKILRMYGPDSGKTTDYYLLITLSLSPFMLLYSVVVMTDLLSIFFINGAIYFFFKYSTEKREYYFFIFVFFTGSAFMTRYAAVMVLIIPVVIILPKFFIPFNRNKLISVLIVAIITVICLAPHFYLKSNLYTALQDLQVRHWNAGNFFRSSFSTDEGFSAHVVPNIIFVFSNFVHPYYIFFGAVLLFFLRKEDLKFPIVRNSLLILILFGLFMAGFPFQNKRHLLLSFPFVFIVLYHPFIRAINLLRTKRVLKTLAIIILCIMQVGIFYYAFSKIYELNRIEKNVAEALSKFNNKVLYTFFVDPALHSYGVNKKIISLYNEKINLFQKDGLVLFNERKFREQWKNENPMINWNYLKNNYNLVKLESFDEGWELYEIE
ncbi:MAG: glycosyltransferase family 39 protein [Ignavibacteriaceae bacterium]|nr:glycosyltransferase family 39 protein [Ignavibacteriaceae bacterium]MCW8960305.1 glycosyltransferase family 39 protein [Ignavibacteriaceae bacterium]MCW8995312.1 glycosyltransferase family 39 protein [Psychromonas sp.]